MDAPSTDAAPPSSRSHEMATAGRNAVKLGLSLIVTWTVALFIRFPLPIIIGKDRFGALNVAESASIVWFTLLDFGVTTYILKEIPVRPKHASDFWGGLLVVRLAATIPLAAGMLFWMARTDHPLDERIAAGIYALAQLAIAYSTSVGGLLQAATRVNRLAVSNVLAKVLWGIGLAIVLVFPRFRSSLPLLAVPLLVSETLKIAVLYPEAKRTLGLEFRVDMKATKLALLGSLPYFISNSAINVGGKLNVLGLDAAAHSNDEVGLFSAAQNLAGLSLFLSPLLQWILMPLMARARTRSEEEVYEIVRRTNEGLLVVLIPITLIGSLGSRLWMHLALHGKYDDGALSFSVLSFGFVLIYLAMTLSTLLIMTGHGWSVSAISLGSLPARPALVLLLAPPCARHFGPGGAALGAALAEVLTSVGIVLAHFIPLGKRAVDRRLLFAGGKSFAVAIAVIAIDRLVLVRIGDARLIVDFAIYAALALATGAIKVADVERVVRGVIARRRGATA